MVFSVGLIVEKNQMEIVRDYKVCISGKHHEINGTVQTFVQVFVKTA